MREGGRRGEGRGGEEGEGRRKESEEEERGGGGEGRRRRGEEERGGGSGSGEEGKERGVGEGEGRRGRTDHHCGCSVAMWCHLCSLCCGASVAYIATDHTTAYAQYRCGDVGARSLCKHVLCAAYHC